MKRLRNIKTHAKLENPRHWLLSRSNPVAERFRLVEEERKLQDQLEEIEVRLAEIQKKRVILYPGTGISRRTPQEEKVPIHTRGRVKA
ncbi:MAG: hypothetical protein Q6354_09580 [Candidatus Brocadiales bacterium]|nr:hypothetical protein [Candidatus Brocadiales bacterium]